MMGTVGDVVRQIQRRNTMKKLMSVLLGLSLVIGTATVAFSQEGEGKKEKKEGKKKGKKKGEHKEGEKN
jgi:hypothetical protein